MRPLLPALACILGTGLFAAPLEAQYTHSMPGLTVQSSLGTVGVLCQPFSCSPTTGAIPRGERITLSVYGPMWGSYMVGVSLPTSQCASVPYAWDRLALDPGSMGILATGTFGTHHSGGFGSCFMTRETVGVNIPPGVPPGTSLRAQALAIMPMMGFGSLSTPVEVTVQ